MNTETVTEQAPPNRATSSAQHTIAMITRNSMVNRGSALSAIACNNAIHARKQTHTRWGNTDVALSCTAAQDTAL